jgi:archaellum component FlaC
LDHKDHKVTKVLREIQAHLVQLDQRVLQVQRQFKVVVAELCLFQDQLDQQVQQVLLVLLVLLVQKVKTESQLMKMQSQVDLLMEP